MVNSTSREGGFTMVLTYLMVSSPIAAATIDVDDVGGARRVVVHTYNKGFGGKKLRQEIDACV
jgi:hypothetical protein